MHTQMQTQRYALVTGGNRGIGLEICPKLVQRGKPVLLTARSADAAQQAAQQLHSSGVDVQAFALEAGDASSVRQLVGSLQKYDQQIDLLINNAAILVRGTWDEATYNETLAVDVTGPLSLTEQLAPLMPRDSLVIMVSSGNGQSPCLTPDYLKAVCSITDLQQLHSLPSSIPLNPSSPQGQLPSTHPGSMAPTYSVAKALLNRSVQLMAAEGSDMQQRGINVVAVSPGWCRTDMGTEAAERSAETGADSVLHPWLNWQPSLTAASHGMASAWTGEQWCSIGWSP